MQNVQKAESPARVESGSLALLGNKRKYFSPECGLTLFIQKVVRHGEPDMRKASQVLIPLSLSLFSSRLGT